MHNPFDRLSILRGRARRTHGGFGVHYQPGLSRPQAIGASIAIAAVVLSVAGGAAYMTGAEQAAPAELAAATTGEPLPETSDVAGVIAAEPVAAPADVVTTVADRQDRPAAIVQEPEATSAQALAGRLPSIEQASSATGSSDPMAAFEPANTDPEPTAAIGYQPVEGSANVEVAETDSEIAALEAEQQVENEEIIAEIRAETGGSAFNSPILQQAHVTQWVNMRAGPSDDAEVLKVVPADATIQAASDCNWCEVAYEGQTGFVYKSFIRWDD